MKTGQLKYYTTALITGATKGIGYEFAKILAEMGKELILVARNEDRLLNMKQSLEKEFNVRVHIFPCDLSVKEDLTRLLDSIGRELPDVDLLINNAGVSNYGEFANSKLDEQISLIQLNIYASVMLTHRVIAAMLKKRQGGILNVASTSGFMPVPFNAVYSATKAFLVNFSLALAEESRKENIIVSCLCPGVVDTDFWDASKMGHLLKRHKNLQKPSQVARYGLSLIDNAKTIGLPGFFLKIKHLIRSLTPKRLTVYYLYHHMKPKNG